MCSAYSVFSHVLLVGDGEDTAWPPHQIKFLTVLCCSLLVKLRSDKAFPTRTEKEEMKISGVGGILPVFILRENKFTLDSGIPASLSHIGSTSYWLAQQKVLYSLLKRNSF